MTETPGPPTADLRCSTWARAEGVDPVATCGSYRGYLLVEWPLPWPRDAAEIPELAGLSRAVREARFRLQLVAPPLAAAGGAQELGAEELGGERFVAAYRWTGARFSGREAHVDFDRGVEAGFELLGHRDAGRPVKMTDVLVCGHGRRDRCCGSLGTGLAADLADSTWSDLPLRYWRTSHTGGHRFAPTAIVLPAGTAWAYLDTALLGGIVARSIEASRAVAHYRGCAGLASREEQVLERAVLGELGWRVLDEQRRSVEAPPGRTRLEVGSGTAARRFEATVAVRRRLPVPECGSLIDAASKTEDELALSGFAEVR